MAILIEYLGSPQALLDVKELLGDKPDPHGLRVVWIRDPEDGDCQLTSCAVGTWICVEIDATNLSVYFKPGKHGYIVSDCGEAICELTRRTGLDSEAAQDLVHEICEDGVSLDDIHAPGLDIFAVRCQCAAERLVESIVAVLSVVARCREAS